LAKYGVSVLKIVVFILLISSLLFSSTAVETEKKVYAIILKAIFPQKKSIYIWTDKPSKEALFAALPRVKVVKNVQDADLLMIFKDHDREFHKKLIFANGYLVFQRDKGNVIGGFYWQKGRPNLVFKKSKLHKNNIKIPKNLEKYVDERE